MTAEKAPRRRRRWPFALVALVAGLVLAAAATELAFRLCWRLPLAFAEFEQAGLYRATAGGGVGFAPGYRGTLAAGGITTTVAINGLGMRGAEVPAKASGERRVLVGGDSLVFGYGVEAEQALPARLQAALRSAGVAATAGNAGMPGIGTREAVARLAELDAPFAADGFVVCCYLGNDATDDLRTDRAVCGGLRFDGPMARLVQSSLRVQLAVRSRALLWFETWVYTNHPTASPLLQLAPSAAETAAMAGLPEFAKTYAGLFLDVADAGTAWQPGAAPVLPRILGNVRAALAAGLAMARGRPLAFVVLPTRWQLTAVDWERNLRQLGFDPAAFRRGAVQERLLAVAAELGIPAFDATAVLAEAPDPAGLFVDHGGHFSVRGNDLVARWLGGELAARLR